ncbi:MAG: hypothetical protein FWC91_13930, partial [Defluviitaleaceae bacterium]|nr:hypothetical protein [Defluviitaleaceae bacterium]
KNEFSNAKNELSLTKNELRKKEKDCRHFESELILAKQEIEEITNKLLLEEKNYQQCLLQNKQLKGQYNAISNSTMWKITSPVRGFIDVIKGNKKTGSK